MNQIKFSDSPNVQYEIADPAVMAIAPVVSVCMITYNHEPYLTEAIEGVIAQKTDFPIELVIGEDCSTDNSRQIALAYQRQYPHLVRVIFSDRNVGMRENARRTRANCRGDYVAFCEGDDYWIDPEKLSVQVAVLRKFKNIDIGFHSAYDKFEKQRKKILTHVRALTDKVVSLPEIIAGDGGFMPTASIVVRRSALISTQAWLDATMPPVGDYFLQVLCSQSGGAYYLNKPMSVYRREIAGSWSEITQKLAMKVDFETRFLHAVRKLEQSIPGQEEAFKRLFVHHYSYLITSATNNNYTQIIEYVLPKLKDFYGSKIISGHSFGSEQFEQEYMSVLATENGKYNELKDHEAGVFRQCLRVVKSLIDYGQFILKALYKNQSALSNCQKAKTIWKLEEQKGFLIARLKRLRRLIIGNISFK